MLRDCWLTCARYHPSRYVQEDVRGSAGFALSLQLGIPSADLRTAQARGEGMYEALVCLAVEVSSVWQPHARRQTRLDRYWYR
jgi:hypothetical protein